MQRKSVLLIAAALLLLLASLLLWAFVVEPNSLTTREVRLKLPNWPMPLDQLKVVAISDIHGGANFINEGKIRQIVARSNEARPDIVVLLGDFVTGNRNGNKPPGMEPETVAENLKGLRARYDVYAVLGNHDWWYDGLRVRHALEGIGILVLENEVTQLQLNGRSLWLAGLADLWTRPQNIGGTISKVPNNETVIVLTHNPDIFPQIPARVSLTLARHTHGGQVNLPFFGRLVVPSDYKQRYAIGHIEENNRHLFVTPGIGTSIIPVRFRVPPEISIITIQSQ